MRPDVVPIPKLRFASFGIYAKESWRITPSQLESCRLVLVRGIGKTKGKKLTAMCGGVRMCVGVLCVGYKEAVVACMCTWLV